VKIWKEIDMKKIILIGLTLGSIAMVTPVSAMPIAKVAVTVAHDDAGITQIRHRGYGYSRGYYRPRARSYGYGRGYGYGPRYGYGGGYRRGYGYGGGYGGGPRIGFSFGGF
jgi:hypothetical protein